LKSSMRASGRTASRRAGRPSSAAPLRRRPPRPPDTEPAGREALGQPGPRAQLAQTGGPVRTPDRGDRCSGTDGSGASPPCSIGLERGDQLGPLDDLDLRIQHGFGQLAENRWRRPTGGPARSVPQQPGPVPVLRTARAAVPRSDCSSSRPGRKAFARRCADTFAITGGTSSRVMTVDSPGGPEGCTA